VTSTVQAILQSVASMSEAEQREVAQQLAERLPSKPTPPDRAGAAARGRGDVPMSGAWTWGESYVLRTPGVMGGDACIRRTRIPIWLLIRHQQLGHDETDLLGDYPGLSQADLDAAWAYYRAHTEEVEAAIVEQERED
jgi:uncharacterized protein (DUF433 family)